MIKNLKLHDIVYISDNSSQKIEHFVRTIKTFHVPFQSTTIDIISLVDASDYMSYIIVKNSTEIGRYFLVDKFPHGNSRQEILDKGMKWLLDDNLEFVEIIGDNLYIKKSPTLALLNGLDKQPCSITEYMSPQDIKNKDVILIECAGSLSLYDGYRLNESDLEIPNGVCNA